MDLASACKLSCRLLEPFSKSYSLFQYFKKVHVLHSFPLWQAEYWFLLLLFAFIFEAGFPAPQWFLWFSELSPVVQQPFFGIWQYSIGTWLWLVAASSTMSMKKVNSCFTPLCFLKSSNPGTLGCAGDTDLCSRLCDWHEAVVQSCSCGLSFTGWLLLNMKAQFKKQVQTKNPNPEINKKGKISAIPLPPCYSLAV